MSTEGYLGNEKLKRVGVEISFSEDEAKEILKCSEDPIYFIKKYVKIVNVDLGIVDFDMWYHFKKKWLMVFHKNRFSICKMPRQVGKTTTTVGYMLWCFIQPRLHSWYSRKQRSTCKRNTWSFTKSI